MVDGGWMKLRREEDLHEHHQQSSQVHVSQVFNLMDRQSEQSCKSYVKNIVLKHEEIFKQQVIELHRLYRVQKTLMAELKNMGVKLSINCYEDPLRIMQKPGKEMAGGSMQSDQNNIFWKHFREHSIIEAGRGDLSVYGDSELDLSLSIGCAEKMKKPNHCLTEGDESSFQRPPCLFHASSLKNSLNRR
ncbi:hypothetical protein J5N97_003447 [Dioscorea zingiberensis]|uniref:Uncharacterized protein n=1 Tax=Dioscorea zingiberensis TaxID=325984 RepID=A0A9D5D4P4_9LILI|nr:hypothetical protein J5N97_003447 [Dioscorea zingiberensis]